MTFKLQPLVLLAFIAGRLAVTAWADSASNQVFVARAQKTFESARQNYLANTNSTTNAWVYASACFDLADLATNDDHRAEMARLGIAACRHALETEPQSAPLHYYLGMNLGQLAKALAPSLSAYRLVHEVEREFVRAAELDVHFDYGGPARTLGLLYFQAPGWPLSVGSKSKAREWLQRAVDVAPDYPDNQLNLAEAQLKWRQRDALAATLQKMDALWPAAKTNFAGVKWETNWQDWDTRRDRLKTDAQRIYGNK